MMLRLLLLVGTFSLLSCELVVEVDLPSAEPTLVLNSFAEAGQPWSAHLTPFIPATAGQRTHEEVVRNGLIEVFKDDARIATLTFRESPEDYDWLQAARDYYVADGSLAEAGETYVIKASAPGFPPVTAKTTVPMPAVLDTVRTRFIPNAQEHEAGQLRIDVRLNDLPHDSYYFLSLNSERDSLQFALWFKLIDAPFQPISPFEDTEIRGLFFSDATFRNQTLDFTIESGVGYGLIYSLTLYTVTEDYYLYHTTRIDQFEARDNPFAEPAPVHGNVQNGYGIFGALAASTPIRINPTQLMPSQIAATYEAVTFYLIDEARQPQSITDNQSDITLSLNEDGSATATLRVLPNRHPDLPEGFMGTLAGNYSIDRSTNLVHLDMGSPSMLNGVFRYGNCGRERDCWTLRRERYGNQYPQYDLVFLTGSI
ncbi:MAG: hypothetical protein RhofKO_20460 [Rhodothermales bacterium]